MFLALNGIIAFGLVVYFATWCLGGKTNATIVSPYNSITITVKYQAKGKIYTGKHLRGDIPFYQQQVPIRYSILNPSSSRINSYMGMYAEPLAWWLVFLLASSMLLLMPNTVFSKGTVFQLQKKFPWISMDEFFPAPGNWWKKGSGKRSPPVNKPQRLESGNSKTLPS